jgi:3-oxoacid CoA-transferase A subunit
VINKIVASFDEAVADVPDGASVHVGGFARANDSPSYLISALARRPVRRMTVITTMAGRGVRRMEQRREEIASMMRLPVDLVDAGLLSEEHLIAKLITTFPATARVGHPGPFEPLLESGEAEVELIGQGSLAERIRCARAGIAAFYTPVGAGTFVAEGKEVREFNGVPHVMEVALPADFAVIRAHQADRYGNLAYRGAPTFNATMAGAARVTIAEVDEIVELGELKPEAIHTPGVYVQRVVERPREPRANWRDPC